ncbi:MAG: FkbM family methyltransferase [Ignavibacteria bacterium]|nr:FkbM family methyltransferase [Ignavibacteria bacterium]
MIEKKSIRNLIVKLLFNDLTKSLFSLMFLNKLTIGIFNYVFENSPGFLLEVFVRLSKQPDFDFIWKVLLSDKSKVFVRVQKNNPQSFQFALSYKWHDRGLRKLETILNDRHDKNSIFIDIGANLGLRSVYSLSQGRKTFLFEPNPKLRKFTESLFNDNNFKNFVIENVCLSNSSGSSRFYISSSSYLSSLDFEHAASDQTEGNVEEINVCKVTLDDYLKTNAVTECPCIIKIDVEGHEYEVIEGASLTINKHRPFLLIEVLRESPKSDLLFKKLSEISYNCYAILNDSSLTLVLINDPEQFKVNYSTDNYLFAPEVEKLSGVNLVNR